MIKALRTSTKPYKKQQKSKSKPNKMKASKNTYKNYKIDFIGQF